MMGRRKNRKGNEINRRTYSEKFFSNYLQGDFVAEGSNGQKLLRMVTEQNLTLESIKIICMMLSKFIDKPVTRNDKRRKVLLIKWLDTNYDACLPYMSQLSFEVEPV